MATVASLARFPVKSMQGEEIDEADVGPTGVAGDRAFAVIDRTSGIVASAKHPKKWGRLLACRAAYPDGPAGAASIEFPDGTRARSDDERVDRLLSAYLGADVTLSSRPPGGLEAEIVWPDIEGLVPDYVTDAATADPDAGGARMRFGLVGFQDVASIHLITTATLRALAAASPATDFDRRRFRPNVVVDDVGEDFVENGWVAGEVTLGASARVRVDIPSMRCVMTTLAQPGLAADRTVLQTVARRNRREIPGLGTWACTGVYASVVAPGLVRVGDPVSTP